MRILKIPLLTWTTLIMYVLRNVRAATIEESPQNRNGFLHQALMTEFTRSLLATEFPPAK